MVPSPSPHPLANSIESTVTMYLEITSLRFHCHHPNPIHQDYLSSLQTASHLPLEVHSPHSRQISFKKAKHTLSQSYIKAFSSLLNNKHQISYQDLQGPAKSGSYLPSHLPSIHTPSISS